MKAWKTVVMVLSATALTATAQPMDAQRGRGGPPDQAGRGPLNITAFLNNQAAVEKVGLTAEQVSSLKSLAAESEKKIGALRETVQLSEAAVRDLMRADTPDRSAIIAAIEKTGAARTDLRKAVVEEQLSVREIVGADALRKIHRATVREWRKDDRQEKQGDRKPPRRHWSNQDEDDSN